MFSVTILSIVLGAFMLRAVMQTIVMLSIVPLSAVTQSVVLLCVIMLFVVASMGHLSSRWCQLASQHLQLKLLFELNVIVNIQHLCLFCS